MAKPLIALPCTAREFEDALHRVCDHDGLWDAKISLMLKKPEHYWYLEIETETRGEAK